MNNTVISVEHLSKQYDLGVIGTGTLSRDLNRWWARLQGKPDPYSLVGHQDHYDPNGRTILALDDISFTVQQGEALGIIGKNGAGKSTLLKILSRVTSPTSGTVKMKGRIGSLLEVGTGFHPELTGRENVYLNGTILGMTRGEVDRKFDEIVDFSGVEQFIDTPVKRYSSGMYVRLGFAVAAHLNPEILIVDEVLAVGDVEFQKKCLGKMGDVAGEGRTVLFVSHNMSSIENLCKSTMLLIEGKIDKIAKTNEVVEYYLELNKIDQNIPLAERTDRDGSQRVICNDFFVVDSNNCKVNSLRSGSDYRFIMSYEVLDSSLPLDNVIASIGVKDVNNQTVLLLRSNFSNQNVNLNGNKSGEIVCEIKDLNITLGKYSITTFLSQGKSEVLDWVNEAEYLFVDSGNYFGTGSRGIPSNCKILTRANWEVR